MNEKRHLLAHILPFGVFMIFVQVTIFLTLDNEYADWWQRAPEQIMYPIQTMVVFGLLLYFWKEYSFRPTKGLGLAILLGTIGIIFWIFPEWLYHKLSVKDWPKGNGINIPFVIDTREDGNWQLLGLAERLEGFDPSFFKDKQFLYYGALFFRFFRMVVVVALVEEIFWRGFLQRYLINPDRSFRKTPFGTHSWKAYFLTTIFFTIVHHPVDYLACLIFGSLIYWISIRTKSLTACVVAHAQANLLLGLYTLQTEKWGFW